MIDSNRNNRKFRKRKYKTAREKHQQTTTETIPFHSSGSVFSSCFEMELLDFHFPISPINNDNSKSLASFALVASVQSNK